MIIPFTFKLICPSHLFQKRTLEPNNEEESHLFDENETFLSELVKKEA